MQIKMEDLNERLTDAAALSFPQEYVRNTLLAHGFFGHGRLLAEYKQQETRRRQQSSAIQDEKKRQERSTLKSFVITEEEKRKTTQLVYHFREGKEFHSLRAPLSLSRPQQSQRSRFLPHWPAEVECAVSRTVFLLDSPSSPEPFYNTAGQYVVSPKIRSADGGGGTVVFSNSQGTQKYFTQARIGPSVAPLLPRHRADTNTSLFFEARFESGNLAKAVQVGRWDYELYLRYDLYTVKHTQWFFFSIQNMIPGQTYRFTIINFYKASSLYNHGMQPVMYSTKMAAQKSIGWRRIGRNIKYFKTDIRRPEGKGDSCYYGLTWSCSFPHANDVCYIAHCYPFTFSDLQDYLYSIASDPVRSQFCKQRTLCHTLAGNPVPLLTITSPASNRAETQRKRTVVVTARVHPGETNSSWMMKGLLDFLCCDSADSSLLRDVFVFKVVPMLNPDGVIVGNYRCSLAGRDLNRNYRTKIKEAYPTVWHTKQLVKKLAEDREVVLFCDLHGHSRKQNVFIYGCDDIQNSSNRFHSRVFPRMLANNAPTKFSFQSSNFKVQKSKEGTSRVFMWKELGITNSYTMEATFCGSNLAAGEGCHFSIKDLESMGYSFCDTLLDYCDPDQTKVQHILAAITEEYRQAVIAKLTALGHTLPPHVDPLDLPMAAELLAEFNSSDQGSDSSDSNGPPMHHLHVTSKHKKKKKKLHSRKERDRKAQLRMTHKHSSQPHQGHTPSSLIPPSVPQQPITATIETPVVNKIEQVVPEEMGVVTAPPTLPASLSTTSITGGIPTHTRERVHERLRRRCSDSTTSLDYPMHTETFDGSTFALESNRDQRLGSCASLGSQMDCPMTILPVSRNQHSQARLSSSRSSLPQVTPAAAAVPPPSGGAGPGPFTSQYMVSHLQDLAAAVRDEDGSRPAVGDRQSRSSTHNLVSLSHLFKQLRPYIMQSASRQQLPPTTTKKEPSPQHTALEYVRFDGKPIAQQYQKQDCKQQLLLQDDKQALQDRQQALEDDKQFEQEGKLEHTGTQQLEEDRHVHLRRRLQQRSSHLFLESPSSGSSSRDFSIHHTRCVTPRSISPPDFPTPTKSSPSSHCSSPLLNHSPSLPLSPVVPSHSFHPYPSLTNKLTAIDRDALHNVHTSCNSDLATPTGDPAPLKLPRPTSSLAITYNGRKTLRTEPSPSRDGSEENYYTTMKSSYNPLTLLSGSGGGDHHGEAKLWGKRTGSAATHKMRVAEAVETLQHRRKAAQGDTQPTASMASSREELMDSSSPPPPPCRVVSSRTASRYGIKPPSEEGVATVSLMLSSSHQSRPPSQHRPRPLHTRYYSKYKRGMF